MKMIAENEEEIKIPVNKWYKVTKFRKKSIYCLNKFQKKKIKQVKQTAQTVQGLKFEIETRWKTKIVEILKIENWGK